MGKLLIIFRYVFLLFGTDRNERRRHIHVSDSNRNNERLCKFWLEPDISLAKNEGFRQKELNEIEALIVEHKEVILKQVDLFLAAERVKLIHIGHGGKGKGTKGRNT